MAFPICWVKDCIVWAQEHAFILTASYVPWRIWERIPRVWSCVTSWVNVKLDVQEKSVCFQINQRIQWKKEEAGVVPAFKKLSVGQGWPSIIWHKNRPDRVRVPGDCLLRRGSKERPYPWQLRNLTGIQAKGNTEPNAYRWTSHGSQGKTLREGVKMTLERRWHSCSLPGRSG